MIFSQFYVSDKLLVVLLQVLLSVKPTKHSALLPILLGS